MHNFGEPLLHPGLTDFVRYCTTRGIAASFYSNGVLLSEEVLAELAGAGLRWLCISEHTRGELARVRRLIDVGEYPIEIRETFRPVPGSLHTWAGQVGRDHQPTAGGSSVSAVPCVFQRQEAVVILWDGRMNVCCIDVEGRGTRGTVDDYLSDPDSYHFRPIDLCAGCSLMRGEGGPVVKGNRAYPSIDLAWRRLSEFLGEGYDSSLTDYRLCCEYVEAEFARLGESSFYRQCRLPCTS